MESPISYFQQLEDPRVDRTKEHLLEDIIFITIAGVVCGAETWNDIEDFGKSKHDWLKSFLKLPEGIPSHDTFNRVFSALDPQAFEQCFMHWTKAVAELTEGEVVSIDGKTLRGSRGKGAKSAVHMVSAWANTNQLVLAQRKVDDKSNEITAIPALLEVLVLKGCIVTIDAMGCQSSIAEAIIDKEANYILALKENQAGMYEQLQDSFRFKPANAVHKQVDVDHGRVETRLCSVMSQLDMIEQPQRWKSLKTLVRVDGERYMKATGITHRETRYYITSLEADAEKIGNSIRAHWGIENSLHWVLDVAFHEDDSRKRAGHAAQNFSLINRIALNLLKNEKSSKRGVKGKRLKAGWDHQYLLKILEN